MANERQIEHWSGEGGTHWVNQQERYDSMLSGFGQTIVDALNPAPGERVLDVGCGNGALTLAISPLVGEKGQVLGLDISGPMLDTASRRARAAGISNVRFKRGDAQVYSFDEESFDGIVSRFGIMFFDDPEAAFANLTRALRPGGRIVFVCWQEMIANEWIMVPVAAALQHVPVPAMGEPGQPGPFALADRERVTKILESAGLGDVDARDEEHPMLMGTSAADVMAFLRGTEFAKALLVDVPDDVAAKAWNAIEEALTARLQPDGIVLSGKAWLVTARRPIN